MATIGAVRGDGMQSSEQYVRLVAEGCEIDDTGRVEEFAIRRFSLKR